MVVGQLAKAGFVTEQETGRQGQRPERTVYTLTDAGRAELRDWLRELVQQPQHEYPAFVAALSLIGALPPSQVPGLLHTRLTHLAQQQAEIRGLIDTALASGVPGLFLIEEDYRLALLQTESAFVDGLIQKITDPATDWTRMWSEFHGENAPASPGE
jgi:hypothetical protein